MTIHLSPDELLTTTRSVRRRLDLHRPVEPDLIRECVEIALQAPIAPTLLSSIHFVVVLDRMQRERLAELYGRAMVLFSGATERIVANWTAEGGPAADVALRGMDSSNHLAKHLHEVPVLIVPCVARRVEGASAIEQAPMWGSIFPAVWSLLLAARQRGLGGILTTAHLAFEREAADVLGLPHGKVTQAALIPLAYTVGTTFRPGPRPPLDTTLHWNRW